jgi:hypothetical protein
VFVLANGKWHRRDLPEGEKQQLRDANNEEDSKSLDYLRLALAALQPLKLNSQQTCQF